MRERKGRRGACSSGGGNASPLAARLPSRRSHTCNPTLRSACVSQPHARRHAGDPVDELPYLEAVLKEGLRRFAPIPMSLPRHVPQGGAVVDGVWLPGGTIVSCQAYTLHRLDRSVFPDPEAFVPERWLEQEGAVERNQLFFTFASGGRGCIGKKCVCRMRLSLVLMVMLTRWIGQHRDAGDEAAIA